MPTIDQYSVATVPLEMFFNDTALSIGTGFVWRIQGQYYLITNWHNLSGRSPNTGKHLSPLAAEPNGVRVWWNAKGKLGEKFAARHTLRDAGGAPIWLVHPVYGNQIDVVALPVEDKTDADMYPLNELPNNPDAAIQVGMDVFVLGYPYGVGIGTGGFPIWKQGTLASEPEMLADAQRYILLDTASRPGMSGSPIIRRSWGTYLRQDGVTQAGGVMTKFVGVYSGRLTSTDPLDAQLGLGWPSHFVEEIIAGNQRDT